MASTNSTSAANSNRIGITGLATGMDTEATIAKIMKYQKAPIDKLKQKTQKLLWEQDTYRSQNTSLAQLRDQLLNLKLSSSYNVRKVNNSNSQVATATAATNAPNATYTVKVTQTATSATNTSNIGVSIRSSVMGDYLEPTTTSPIKISAGDGNNTITIALDGGTAETLTLTDATYSSLNSLSDLAKDIQTKIDANTTLKGKVFVKLTDDHELQFVTAQKDDGTAHTLVLGRGSSTDTTLSSLGFNDQATTKELVSSPQTEPVDINSTNNTFKITLGNGTTQTITLDNNSSYTLADLAANIKTKIQALGGDYANVNVDVTKYNQIRITPTNTSGTPASIKLEAASGSNFVSHFFGNDTNDIVVSEQVNPLDTTSMLWNQKNKFINSSFFEGRTQVIDGQTVLTDSTFSFAINGQSFSFDLTKASLDDVINTINANSKAGVSAYYDSFSDKLMLTASKTGANLTGSNIAISGDEGFLSQLFNITQAGEKQGQNAIVSINGGPDTQKTDNIFTMSGVTFNLAGTGTTMVSVTTDTSAMNDQIQKFVDSYNKVITAMNVEITTQRPTGKDKYTYYEPLTDEQKEAMTDDQITAWTDKAKTGLLHNDPMLIDTMNSMAMNLQRVVNTPRSINGNAISGTIDLTGSSHFKVTLGSQTREIYLDEKSYGPDDYDYLVEDIQNKLNMAFGANTIKVGLRDDTGGISFTTQNIALTVNKGTENNGLEKLGFTNGDAVKQTCSSLADIGLTTGAYSSSDPLAVSKLTFDADKFQQAMLTDPDAVIQMLTYNGGDFNLPDDATEYQKSQLQAEINNNKGVFYSFYDLLNESTTGIIKQFTNKAGVTGQSVSDVYELGQQMNDIAERINNLQDRFNEEEDRLYDLFTRMETTINNYNAQSAWLTSQLGGSSS